MVSFQQVIASDQVIVVFRSARVWRGPSQWSQWPTTVQNGTLLAGLRISQAESPAEPTTARASWKPKWWHWGGTMTYSKHCTA